MSSEPDSQDESSGRWSLAFASAVHDQEQPLVRTSLRTLAPVAIERVHNDNRAVRTYSTSHTLVQCVWLNVQELLEGFVEQIAPFAQTKASSPQHIQQLSLGFARGLLNILGSFRALLDHSQTALSREFGDASPELRHWKDATAREYDAFFAYRLIYSLRNYTQHLGMPPLTFELNSSASADAVTIRVDIKRDALLDERATWKAAFRAELANGPPQIPLMDALDTWSGSFWRISRVLLNIWRRHAEPHAREICEYRATHGLPEEEGEVCAVWLRREDEEGQRVGIKIVHVEERLAREILVPPDWLTE